MYLRAIGAARQLHLHREPIPHGAARSPTRLAARLAERDGPEVVIIGPKQCEGFIETAVMDRGRGTLPGPSARRGRASTGLRMLASGQHRGRRAARRPINVHAKLLIVDDRLLVVGSANLANRSMALDTECNLAIEASGASERAAVLRARDTLLGEHLGCGAAAFSARARALGSVVAAIDALNGGRRRLEPLTIEPLVLPPELAASVALTDPSEPITMEVVERSLAPPSRRRRLVRMALRSALTILALVAIALAARSDLVGETGAISDALSFAEQNRLSVLGFAAISAAFCLATMLFVPVNFVIAATGALFGPLPGLLYALVGALLGAGLSFAIGRALGREWIRRIASRRLNAINQRLERHGLLAMTVLRLLPIAPFTVVNLVAGASEIRARDYMLGSLFGMTPGIVLMTLFGDRLGVWLRDPEMPNLLVVVGVAVAALLLTWALRRWSRRGASS